MHSNQKELASNSGMRKGCIYGGLISSMFVERDQPKRQQANSCFSKLLDVEKGEEKLGLSRSASSKSAVKDHRVFPVSAIGHGVQHKDHPPLIFLLF